MKNNYNDIQTRTITIIYYIKGLEAFLIACIA